MKRIDKSFSNVFPKVEFFIDDLEKIHEILSVSSNKIIITINDQYKIDDFTELEQIKDDEIQKISIKSYNPLISVDLDSNDSRYYSVKDNSKNRGIYERINHIMERRKIKQLFFQRYPAILGILLGLSFTILSYLIILGLRFTFLSIPGILIIMVLFVGGYSLFFKNRYPSKFNICRRKELNSYWERNKDDIIRGLIVSLLSAQFTSSITLIITYFI